MVESRLQLDSLLSRQPRTDRDAEAVGGKDGVQWACGFVCSFFPKARELHS